MKFTAFIFAVIFFIFSVAGIDANAGQLDSLTRLTLDKKLKTYVDALKYESRQVQKEEADFMIEICRDSSVMQYVAMKLYDHYLNSPVMGSEDVAIHIFDKWFNTGKVSFYNEIDYLNATIFADFNRDSQIGREAPSLELVNMEGGKEILFGANGDSSRFKVLYFYDTDCSKCKIETILLRNTIETYDYPVDLYAVYTGDDSSEWEQYVKDSFDAEVEYTGLYHYWDPQIESDFQRKYGVLQTPRLFLVRPDGVIKGRGLDVMTLSLMLKNVFEDPVLDYGQNTSYYDDFFKNYGPVPSFEDIKEVTDHVKDITLPKGDTTLYRQMTGDLLYYLLGKRNEDSMKGAEYLIDNYILAENKVWTSQDDSLKLIGFAEIMSDLLSRSSVGERIPDHKVQGTLLSGNKEQSKVRRFDKLRGKRNIIIFHTEGCEFCKAEKAAAILLARRDKSIKVFMINIDDLMLSEPELASQLFDDFDLSSLPFIIETDRKGKVLHKYSTLLNNP